MLLGHHKESNVQQRRPTEGEHGQHLLQARPIRKSDQVLQDGTGPGTYNAFEEFFVGKINHQSSVALKRH